MPKQNIFEGCPKIINAAGTLTRLSAGPLAPGVLDAMSQADDFAADMFEVQAHASRRIAQATGAEAGLVTSGASAGLLLAAAACLAKLDISRMNALPDAGSNCEVIVARGHRNGYDHALLAAGARFVEVGFTESMAGAGVRDAEPWDYESAVSDRTAAILYVVNTRAQPALEDVVAVARRHNIPVIVDAAAELPPAANLTRFIRLGADLVVFSGGKVLGGPAGTGILCGRAELIMSAALQMLDVDVPRSTWFPPDDFINTSLFDGLPRQGIGRCCKVGKHEVFGLLAALNAFLAESDAVRHTRWMATCTQIAKGLTDQPGLKPIIDGAEDQESVPILTLRCESSVIANQMRAQLLDGDPKIHAGFDPFCPDCILINPTCLRPGDIPLVSKALSAMNF